MHLAAERGNLLLVDSRAYHLDIGVNVRPLLERLLHRLDRLRMHADDLRIINITRRMNHARVHFDFCFGKIEIRQIRRDDFHAPILDLHRLFDKVHAITSTLF